MHNKNIDFLYSCCFLCLDTYKVSSLYVSFFVYVLVGYSRGLFVFSWFGKMWFLCDLRV